MNALTLGRWPGGRPFAVTFSYDDGREHDRRLIEIFNRHGMRATFNLNSGLLDAPGYVAAAEVASLYACHEVAVHTVTHPFPTRLPMTLAAAEVMEDRRALEKLTGGVVDGMAYPYGDFNEDFKGVLRHCGIRYSRAVQNDCFFRAGPTDWLDWRPTCHDRDADGKMLDAFFNVPAIVPPGRLLFIWGHSYEFDRPGGWEAIEALCAELVKRGGKEVWFATNGEVCDYVTAVRGLRFSADHARIVNNAAFDVWVDFNGVPTRIPPRGAL